MLNNLFSGFLGLLFTSLLIDQSLVSLAINTLKVHKRENFLGSDFEICTFFVGPLLGEIGLFCVY